MASPPVSRVTVTTTLQTYNTLFLKPYDIYILVTPFAGTYYYNILNLGPGNVYLRGDGDPVVGGAATETLPASTADNAILVPDGLAGLRVMCDPHSAEEPDVHTRITVRLVRG